MAIHKQGLLLFCILMFCYAYIHKGLGANQNSRLDFLHSLFESGTFRIDAYQENTNDKAVSNGHYYSDKAPGIAFLSLPAYSVSVGILKLLSIEADSSDGWLITSWITTAGTVGLITALGGVAMFAFLCSFVGDRMAFMTSLVVFLGSAPFPYATMLYSHAAIVGLISIALWAISDQLFFLRLVPGILVSTSSFASSSNIKRYILAGLCCGFAISSEYTAATAAAGVLALALLTDIKHGLLVAFAAIPPLLLIPINNWVCFGSPLAFGYHHLAEAEFQDMNLGFFGVTFPPKPGSMYLILFSPERGLFFWTPFFLMAFLGLKAFLKISFKLFWVALVVIVLHIVCISGYYMPGGGLALGSRHLATILPLLTIFAAFGLLQKRWAGIVLGYYSILLTGVATLINGMPAEGVLNPFVNYYIPRLLDGDIVHSIGSQLGVPSYFSAGLVLFVMFGAYVWGILYNQPKETRKTVVAACRTIDKANINKKAG